MAPEPAGDRRISVPIEGPLAPARFVERPNRFLVRCRLEGPGASARGRAGGRVPPSAAGASGALAPAHLPDPGRLTELLVEGRRVWLRPESGAHRKTAWTAVLVETPDGGGLVSVDTTLPNRLIGRALEAGWLEELAGWEPRRREAPVGASRIDFVLSRPDGRRLALEVKSVTLVEGGVGLFPDAVTARGARHVRELAEVACRDGWEAAVLFVLQRNDARRVVAAESIDPAFAAALAEAKGAGVRVLGRRCRVSLEGVTLGEPIPAG